MKMLVISLQSSYVSMCTLIFKTKLVVENTTVCYLFFLIYWEVIYLFCISHGSCAVSLDVSVLSCLESFLQRFWT